MDATKNTEDGVDVLKIVGEFGKFQKLLIVFYVCSMTSVFRTFVVYNDIMLTITPDHWCTVIPDNRSRYEPEGSTNGGVKKQRRAECSMIIANSSQETEEPRTEICPNGFTYDFSDPYYPTVASELDLVCDKKPIATISHSIFWISFQIGGPIFGFISDRYGRIPSAVLAHTLGCVAGIATVFPFHWIFYLCSRSLAGFSFSGMVAAGLTLGTEYVGRSHRTSVVLAWTMVYTVLNTGYPWLAYLLKDWKVLTAVTSISFLAVPLSFRILPESIKWLMTQRKFDRAIGLVEYIAKMNGKQLSQAELNKIRDAMEAKNKAGSAPESKANISDLFKTPNLRKITILVTLCWVGKSCLALGLAYLSVNLSDDFYYSISIGAFAEVIGCILQIVLLQKLGRRVFSILTLFATALSLNIVPLVPQDLKMVKQGLILTARMTASAAFNTAFLYHTEVFPTVARAQGIGIRFAIGNFGAMLAPFITSLASNHHFQNRLQAFV